MVLMTSKYSIIQIKINIMKTILVCTDFSEIAEQAACYGFRLAATLRSKLLLANAIPVPIPMVTPAGIDIPYTDNEVLQAGVLEGLGIEKDKLYHGKFTKQQLGPDLPEVEIAAGFGPPYAYIAELVKKENSDLVIAGLSGAGNASRFFLGSTSRDLINSTLFPVLLLPRDIHYEPVKQIVFASELNDADFYALSYLAEKARMFNASIQIAHIVTGTEENEGEKIDRFLSRAKAMLPGTEITSLNVYNQNEMNGLDWLQDHTELDWLVMVHREHSFLSNLFRQPFSQQMARKVKVPLLIIPENYKTIR